MSEKGKRLKEMFYRKGDPVVHVSAPTPYGARMLEFAGFEYIFIGGDATFGTMLGRPGQYLDTTEKVFIAKYFVDAVDLPVVIDADELNSQGPAVAARTTREYIRAGVAGMDIDDRMPQHQLERANIQRESGISAVIPIEDMTAKIEAIIETRKEFDPDFLLRVRTYGININLPTVELTERIQAFEEAGAEVIYLGGINDPNTGEVLQACIKAVNVPVTGNAQWISYDMAKEMGMCEIRYPYELEMTMHSAGWEFLKNFKEQGFPYINENRDKYEGNPYMAVKGVQFQKQGTQQPRPDAGR